MSGKILILTSHLLNSLSEFKIQNPQPHTQPQNYFHRQSYAYTFISIFSQSFITSEKVQFKNKKQKENPLLPTILTSAPDHSWKWISPRSQMPASSNKLFSVCGPKGGDHPQSHCVVLECTGAFQQTLGLSILTGMGEKEARKRSHVRAREREVALGV